MEFLEHNWQGIIMVVGGAIAWIFRLPLSKLILKQNMADIKATQVSTDANTISNLAKSMDIYVAIIDDITNKLKEKDRQIEQLISENTEQKLEMDKLIIEIRVLKEELNNFLKQ